eukprot:147462-Pelagomonas_calceolata.AAC.1
MKARMGTQAKRGGICLSKCDLKARRAQNNRARALLAGGTHATEMPRHTEEMERLVPNKVGMAVHV